MANYTVNRCCFCASVKTGTYIIGGMHAFGLILGLMALNPIKVVFELFTGLTFLWMVYKDGEQSRLLFFAAFSVYVVILGCLEIYFTLFPNQEEDAMLVKNYCLEVEKS